MKKSCKNCNHFEHCVRVYNLDSRCVDYEAKPLTNEQWFCGLSTEEKAKWIEEKMAWSAQEQGTFTAKGWECWLKEIHHE